jgi:diacylglycerol kinase (ATP)
MVVASQRLLVLNPQAGGLSEDEEATLREELSDFEVARLEEGQDLAALLDASHLAPDATVVVAGGDGTVAAAARALAGTDRRLGIVPLGTFNNFARGLGMPLDALTAARALHDGREGAASLGRINGRAFLEAASLGLFGDLINLGEAAKELEYGELAERVGALSSAPFDYRLAGDIEERGRARALVAANTPSTGALLPVGSVTPEEPVLELSILGAGHAGMLAGLFARALPFVKPREPGRLVRKLRVETDPPISVYADAERIGETPADILLEVAALNVILPR